MKEKKIDSCKENKEASAVTNKTVLQNIPKAYEEDLKLLNYLREASETIDPVDLVNK